MPAAPVHHTPVDKTGTWDGPAAVKAFDKKEGDFPKFYAWIDEGEHDEDADGTDKEDGWGPHHDVGDDGVPHDANLKGIEAAMAALNGAHGANSRIPDGDRQGVWDHLAAHYTNAGVAKADIPPLARSGEPEGETRASGAYSPAPYSQRAGENVECPDCGRMNDGDASYCDQCDCQLAGRDDISVDGVTEGPDYEPSAYEGGLEDTVQCPGCKNMNCDDAHFCDQCGLKIEGVGIIDTSADGLDAAEEADVETDPNGVSTLDDAGDRSKPTGRRSGTRSRPPAATPTEAPTANLVRCRPGNVLVRSAAAPASGGDAPAGDGTTMYGHFSLFNEWYEVDSWFEGRFMESVAPTAFDETFAGDAIRCIYNHGWDELFGMRALGPVGPPHGALRADDVGAYYEVPLLDTATNRDHLLPLLQGRLMSGEMAGSQLGASFRFDVIEENWNTRPPASDFNPDQLPQRTLMRVAVPEFGPGMFPVSEAATAGVRSLSGEWLEKFHDDPAFLVRATERLGPKPVHEILAQLPEALRSQRREQHQQHTATEPPAGRAERVKNIQRRAKALTL